MHCACTLFDYTIYPPKPLASVVDRDGEIEFYFFYLRGTGNSLKFVEDQKEKFVDLFADAIVVNDYKSHLLAFNLPLEVGRRVYESYPGRLSFEVRDKNDAREKLVRVLGAFRSVRPEPWRQLLADASVVYQHMENCGAYDGYLRIFPTYGYTATGRSKTTGTNIQGAGDDADIRSSHDNHAVLVHFDWISADLRAASIMSGDEHLNMAFTKSDPYTYLADELDDPGISRADCKLEMLRSIYSLDTSSPVFDIFPQFRTWMRKCLEDLYDDGHLTTMLGRRFSVGKKDRKHVFNATIQGSVAHAMQNVLRRVYQLDPSVLLAEVHDSLILACSRAGLKDLVSNVGKIMVQPFDGLLDSNPRFPVRISVGLKWRQWKVATELR